MITTTAPEPERNFWEELTNKVAEIGQRTREKAQTTRLPGEKSLQKRRFTRFQLRQAWHRSQQESMAITNRLKYIEVERQRHSRTLQIAKKKYQRMMEIRSRSIKQKEQCRKILQVQRISLIQEESIREASEKAHKIKEERVRTTSSVQRVKLQHQSDGKLIRDLRQQHQENIKLYKNLDVAVKRQLVEKAHNSIELSRLRLTKLQDQRVQMGKQQHKEYLRKQLEVNISQNKKNSVLRQKLQDSLYSAGQDKEQTLSKLNQYKSTLVPTPKNSRVMRISFIQST